MPRLIAMLGLLSLTMLPTASADAAEPDAAGVGAAIGRGLDFLAKDALAWRDEHHCVSCHHASLVVWAMREAKRRDHKVDEPVFAELTRWIAESGDGKTGVPRPENIPRALNEKAVSFALALASDPQPDDVSQKGLQLLLSTVKSDQVDSGAWASWPETRPPIFGNSDERTTAQAVLALLPAAAAGDESARAARDRGVAWLDAAKTDDDPQSVAMRLVLWQRMGRGSEHCEPLAKHILERQNADGGWSQTTDMPSDAWATGQALYALAHAGRSSGDDAIRRGQAFLVSTQRADGSWPMISRPTKPGGEGSKSLIPIVGAGSSWAVIGLARSQ
jgi:squalene-hopene/tetraprenyl-beta-curcumene cyclase